MTKILNFIDKIENTRLGVIGAVEVFHQKQYEQYFTPNDISIYMSSLFSSTNNDIEILDAGAGIGNLGAFVSLKYLNSDISKNVHLTSIEWDKNLIKYIDENLSNINKSFKEFSFKIINENFYIEAKKLLKKEKKYNRIIINPPYSITSKNTIEEINILKELDVQTPNSYSNFIELCYRLLTNDGELVAIVPRSFCNGTRFTKFRIKMLKSTKIEFIHSFESREEVFKEYGIFQEIVIIKLTKRPIKKTTICISDKLDKNNCEKFKLDKITFKNDPYKFIHIPVQDDDLEILDKIYKLPSNLKKLGLTISTGKVVEYRERDLSNKQTNNSAVVIYQRQIIDGKIDFSIKGNSKPFLSMSDASYIKMIPSGNYIIMKRMSYKENKKRISTAILTEEHFETKYLTVENHLNYIHKENKGIEKNLAVGLNAYLNSNILDKYIRRFNGHTQINASDIISLPMPSYDILINIGKLIHSEKINENEINNLLFMI